MWSTLLSSNQPKETDFLTYSFPIHPRLENELHVYQCATGLSDELISSFINSAVMSTNLPLTTRRVLEDWSLNAWLNQRPLENIDNAELFRRLQISIFTSVTCLASDRLMKPHKYGFVILTMDVGRITLLSFPRFRYNDVIDKVAELTSTSKMSIRGWKNVKLDRFAFVESLGATIYTSGQH